MVIRAKLVGLAALGWFSLVGLYLAADTAYAQSLGPTSALKRVSDGQADATEALQQAVDSCGGLLELPTGSFRISRPINIQLKSTGYLSIRGGSASKIIMAGMGPALRIVGTHFKSADPRGFSDQVWQSERMPTITGIAIEGAHEEADGIEAVGTMQLIVSRVHLRKLRHGIRLRDNNRNVLIDACHIYENTGVGVFYDDVNLHQSNITGCHISYCDQGGIVSRQGNVRNIHITGCDIESNMSPDAEPTANVLIDCRESDYGTAEVAITGCTIQHNDRGPQSANIRIIGQSNPSRGNPVQEGHVTITGNILSDVQTNVWLESCRGVTLTGNTFWMGFEHNLLIDHCSHIVVGPNNFDRNPRYNYGHSLDAKNRLVIRNSRDCTLTGLHIAHVHNSSAALTLEQCDRMNVSGLTILDCDVGLALKNVTRSLFSSCLIRDDRKDQASKSVVIEGGFDNRLDSTLSP